MLVHRHRAPLWRRLAHDRRGLAALEFALIAPLMILVYFGLATLSSAIIAARHTNHATTALGDLVSQCTHVSDLDLANLFSATGDIMAPLPLASLTQTVTGVIDNNGVNQVQWSRTYSAASGSAGAGLTPGAPVTLPSTILTASGQTVVMTETVYRYTPPFLPAGATMEGPSGALSLGFMKSFSFDDVAYATPRQGASVVYTGPTASGGDATQASCGS